jgi:hypothetical protein
MSYSDGRRNRCSPRSRFYWDVEQFEPTAGVTIATAVDTPVAPRFAPKAKIGGDATCYTAATHVGLKNANSVGYSDRGAMPRAFAVAGEAWVGPKPIYE